MKENKVFASLKIKEDADRLVAIKNARLYESCGANGIVFKEKYSDDAAHEQNLHTLQDICATVSIPVYAKVNKNCKEDVKKYLYAGCAGVVISGSEGSLLEESIKRFTNKQVNSYQEKKIASNIEFSDLKVNDSGLIPCIVQDVFDNTVLMMAYMNEESFNATLKSGKMTYYSRSRNKLWEKGEESGHIQYLKSLSADCDLDTLLAKVEQVGVACHTGSRSCFFNDIVGKNNFKKRTETEVISEVYDIILDRKTNPKEGSYTNYLFNKGIDKILKKVGEEATEIIIAAKNPESKEIVYETADFMYHLLVLLALNNISWDEILKELKNR